MPNEVLLANLNTWAAEAKIDPRGFDCRYYSSCNGDDRVHLDRGNTVVMSYVGREYGLPSPYPIPRLVIVGMDHGQPHSKTFQGRRDQIENAYQDSPGKAFNQHYAGVVRTAAGFLGCEGNHCAVACKAKCARSSGISSEKLCVLDRLVQPNLVKCVSVSAVDMTCKATRQMRTNCCHHLFAELKELRPDIVVVHGSEEQGIVLYHMRDVDHFDLAERIGVPKVLYWVPDLKCHFVFLWHPSRNMMARIWESRAVPALDYLRRSGIVS